eukprot:EG_transcript_7857
MSCAPYRWRHICLGLAACTLRVGRPGVLPIFRSSTRSFSHLEAHASQQQLKAEQKKVRARVKLDVKEAREKKRLEEVKRREAQLRLEEVQLTAGQRAIMRDVQQGHSVFFTGCAGTGKSFLMQHIVHERKLTLGEHCVFVTATTGNAACNIGGTTLHHFAGLHIHTPEDQMLIMARRARRKQWQAAKVLVIDEVSMLQGSFLDSLNQLAQDIRGNRQPFGGLQLVLCGDFLQLPPVLKTGQPIDFAFEAQCWRDVAQKEYELLEVFRQRDQQFVSVLNKVRMGEVDQEVMDLLTYCKSVQFLDGVEPTLLFPLRSQVARINESRLASLEGAEWVNTAVDRGEATLLDSNVAKDLVLKVGAQVVLLRNVDQAQGLVNGSRGVVVGFHRKNPVVRFRHGLELEVRKEVWTIKEGEKTIASRRQYPLAHSWALSIHKSQGLSLDAVQIHLAHIFEMGQAYTGLSRARDPSSLCVPAFRADRIRAHPKAKEYHLNLHRTFHSAAAPRALLSVPVAAAAGATGSPR